IALDPSTVVVREVKTQPEAALERFVGSPTIRIDGVDVQPPGEEPVGLTCRVYHRRDGRISPTPDPADVRDALRTARTATTERNRRQLLAIMLRRSPCQTPRGPCTSRAGLPRRSSCL